jgi:hypothetical protein
MTLAGRAVSLCALAAGCQAAPPSPDRPAPEETVASALVDDGQRVVTTGETPPAAPAVHYYGPHPPPAPREDRGVAPGPGSFWAPGFFRWNGREHVWTPGGWQARREGLDYVAPHWENVYSRYEYIPGRWFHAPR